MANTKKEDEDMEFPGYPHYPAKEDIMNSKNDKRVDLDVENFSRSQVVTSHLPGAAAKPAQIAEDDPLLSDVEDDAEKVKEPNDADITPEDLVALGEEDTNFKTSSKPAENDLDMPGTEEDDGNEEIGEEDEENNYYSLGGDAHEDLEEDKEV